MQNFCNAQLSRSETSSRHDSLTKIHTCTLLLVVEDHKEGFAWTSKLANSQHTNEGKNQTGSLIIKARLITSFLGGSDFYIYLVSIHIRDLSAVCRLEVSKVYSGTN